MSKTAEDYFNERFETEHWDKHDKRIKLYDFFDMTDFADHVASQESRRAVEEFRSKALMIVAQYCEPSHPAIKEIEGLV